jgi:GDP-4-dehydro-6-deoxy-D-mannose reductase
VTRSFNHIGPGQHPGFFASAFARQLAQIEAGLIPATVTVGNLDARRDLTDVRDTVRAYVDLLRAGSAGECYNVCAGRDYRIGEVLERLVAQLKCSVEVTVDPAKLRPNDVPLVVGSAARLTSDTGWVPHIDLDSSLGDLLQWWRDEVARGASHALPSDA